MTKDGLQQIGVSHTEQWRRRYRRTVSNIKLLARPGRFDHVFFLVSTGVGKIHSFNEAIEIIDELKDAARNSTIVFKQKDDGSQALWPYLQGIGEIFGAGRNTGFCYDGTINGLRNLGFAVRAVADAAWTAVYQNWCTCFQAHNMALRQLKHQGVPILLTKNVP
jgi:nicotinamidase-related amidase